MQSSPNTIQNELERDLSSGERLLWSGQPQQGVMLRSSDALFIPFSVLWCGFAIFWESMALRAPNAPVIFPLWGIPFVLVGLYMVLGRFFIDARQRKYTFYGLTNERVLIVWGKPSRSVKSISLNTLGELSLTESTDGRGSIVFGAASFYPRARLPAGWPGMDSRTPQFESIADARRVFEMIRRQQKTPSG